MSHAIATKHGEFGRACLYQLNRSMATHAHREGHLIFCLGGSAPAITVSGQTTIATNSNAVAVNSLQPHDMQFHDAGAESLLLVLYIKQSWFQKGGRRANSALQFGHHSFSLTSETKNLVDCVANLLIDGDKNNHFDSCLLQLTRECYRQSWMGQSGSLQSLELPRLQNNGISDHRVRKSIEMMKNCVGDDCRLHEIARQSGLSRPHFFKLFRANVGITPNVYMNTLRMEIAIKRLTTTNAPVTSIGLDLGFASQASFSRFFSANVGIPPSDYRRASLVE